MTDRAVSSLATKLASLERQIRTLATAARAPFTTVQGGVTSWLTDAGEEAIAIGVDEESRPFIRAWNAERSAVALEVVAGVGTFPLTASSWQPDYEFSGMDASGRRTNTTSTFQFQWHVVLSLVTPYVRFSFSPFPDVLATANELRFQARALDDRSDGGVHDVGSVISFDNSYPNVQTGVLTIPSDVLASGSDVVGSVILLSASTRIATGSGTLAISPVDPAYCVESP